MFWRQYSIVFQNLEVVQRTTIVDHAPLEVSLARSDFGGGVGEWLRA